MREQLPVVLLTIKEAILGERLLQLFNGATRGRIEGAKMFDHVGSLSGVVALPGFEEGEVPVFLASNGLEARFVMGNDPNPIIRIETGVFDKNGANLEIDELGNIQGERAHLIAVTHSRKNWQPWATEALLYDRSLAAIRGYAVKELGVVGAKRELFYKD